MNFFNITSSLCFVLVFLRASNFYLCKGSNQKPKHFTTAKMLFYFELGGASGRYAVNYSKEILSKREAKFEMPVQVFSMWRHGKLDSKASFWLPVIPLEVQQALYGQVKIIIWKWVLGYFLLTQALISSGTFEFSDKVGFSGFHSSKSSEYRLQSLKVGIFLGLAIPTPIMISAKNRRKLVFQSLYWAGVSLWKRVF